MVLHSGYEFPRPAGSGDAAETEGNGLQPRMDRQWKEKVGLLYGLLLTWNALAWIGLWLLSRPYPFLFPLGVLAYVFGLRHAADADHIAAIDNTTRKLMHEGQRPVGVGFYFSLGHSTIVFILSLGLALATRLVEKAVPHLEGIGNILGTVVSAGFLYLIAVLNLVILAGIYDLFRRLRQAQTNGKPVNESELERLLEQRGLMNRFFGKLSRTIRHSWQMYPVGLLFGLGFDTASEVALLAMSSAVATHHMPIYLVLILPILFAAGMSLVDTTDGVLMQFAYNWAFLKPIRKVYYNLTITTISVLVALVIGTIEWLQVIARELGLKGWFWGLVGGLSFESIGYLIIFLLLASWAVALAVYKLKGYENPGIH